MINKSCLEIETIIKDWFADIEKIKKTWEGIRSLNPDFEQVSEESWYEKEARLWLHGETNIWKAYKLEEWLMISPSLSKTAESLALDHYLKWEEYIREEGDYTDFSSNDIVAPNNTHILIEFILEIAKRIEKNGWGCKKQ